MLFSKWPDVQMYVTVLNSHAHLLYYYQSLEVSKIDMETDLVAFLFFIFVRLHNKCNIRGPWAPKHSML